MKHPLLLFFIFTPVFLLFSGAESGSDAVRDAAQKGDVRAMVRLGDEFFTGRNRPRNLELAAFWYGKAAAAELPLGLYRYGVCREFGWGVKKDAAAAYRCYEQAGNFGPARLRFAELTLSGIPGTPESPGVSPDREKAFGILRKLCEENFTPAFLKLARLLYDDRPRRKTHAPEIYALALRAADVKPPPPEALLFLARLLQEGVGTQPDFVYARALLEIAAAAGNPEAQFLFAETLESGRGTPVNAEKAFEFYRKAAAANHPGALTRMGDYLLSGTRLPHDPSRARKNFQQAALENYPPALRKLGWCFENGIGGEKDLRRAFNFYERSANGGDPQGNYLAGRCFLLGIGVKADPAGAVFFFRRSAALGNREGTLALADCLEKGRGCTPDPELARKLREAAARL